MEPQVNPSSVSQQYLLTTYIPLRCSRASAWMLINQNVLANRPTLKPRAEVASCTTYRYCGVVGMVQVKHQWLPKHGNRGAGAPRTSTRGQFKALCSALLLFYPFLWVGFVGIILSISPRKEIYRCTCYRYLL